MRQSTKEPARMGDHPGGPLRPARGEGGGRARRSQLLKIGLSRPGRPSRCRRRSRRRRTGAPSRSGDSRRRSSRRRARCWQPPRRRSRLRRWPAPMPQPPRAWAALVGMARLAASVAMATRRRILDLMVMVVSLWIWCGPMMALMRHWSDRGRKVQRGGCGRRALCEKSQMGEIASRRRTTLVVSVARTSSHMAGDSGRDLCRARVRSLSTAQRIHRGGAACCGTSCAEAEALACTAMIA